MMTKSLALTLLLLAGGASAGAQNAIAVNPAAGPTGPFVEGVNCAGGEIYDDGTVENGYAGNAALISLFQGTMQFTPASYPWNYSTVCICFTTIAAGGATLDFDVEVRDDDGVGGGPGTLLGTVPVSIADIPVFPGTVFHDIDISSAGITIPSGNAWIGVAWNPMDFPSRFVCADETPATPLRPGFVNFNNPGPWEATESVFPSYRAKLIRAEGAPSEADLAITKTGAVVGDQIVYTIDVENLGPADATGVVVTDTLPAAVTYVSDTCGGSNVPPWTWNVGALAASATDSCEITVSINPDPPQFISNTATVTADQGDPIATNDSSTVRVDLPFSVVEIPTAGSLGLILLALLLAGGAWWVLSRRSSVGQG